jgi:preprotein translocase subunit YajC
MELVAQVLPLLLLFAIFYFLIIKPQQNQQKEHTEMVNNLQKGDKIITNGGLMGEVVKVDDNFIKIKLNDSVIVKVQKNFIASKDDNNKISSKNA